MLIRYSPASPNIKVVSLKHRQVILATGINEVTDAEWNEMKPFIKELIDAKIIVQANEGDKNNLKDLPANKAYALIGECVDHGTLQKWYNEITDEAVRLQLLKRMAFLKIDPKDKVPPVDENDGDAGNDTKEEKARLGKMTIEELTQEALLLGVDVDGLTKKGDLMKAILER